MANLCLISSNIRFDNPGDGHNAWVHRKSFLSHLLLSHAPDIIATQEGRYDQLTEFEKLLKGYQLIDHHRSWIKERMYPSFFVRKDSFELIRSEDLWLSSTPEIAGSLSFGSTFPRLVTWLRLQLKNSDKTFLIANTHLDHVSSETRNKQTKVLANKISSIQNENEHLVIMGDFNDSPKSTVRTIINKTFPHLIDGWEKFNSIEETSHHAFNGECQNGSRIDWILLDHRLKLEHCFLDKTHREGKYPSDHFPVVCRINI